MGWGGGGGGTPLPVDLASWLSFHHQALPAVVSLCDANAIRRPGREESGGDLARSPPFSIPNSKKGNKPKLGDHHHFPRQHSGLRLPLFSSPPIAACFIFRVSGSEEAFDREEEASDPTLSSRPARRPTSSFSPFSSF